MQVLIIDNHPTLTDSRRSRHISSCKEANLSIFRIHIDNKLPKDKSQCSIVDGIPTYVLGKSDFLSIGLPYVNTVYFIFSLLSKKVFWKDIFARLGIDLTEKTIIHIHDPIVLLFGNVLKSQFSEAKIVYDRHETYERISQLKSLSPVCLFEKIANRSVDGVIMTVDVASYIDTVHHIFPKAEIDIVPNYPELIPDVHDVAKKKLASPISSPIKFVCIGTLDWVQRSKTVVYDISQIISIAERLLCTRSDIQFIIGGKSVSDEMTAEFQRLEKLYPQNFSYVGYVSYDELIKHTLDATFGFFLTNPVTPYWVHRSSNKIFEFINCGVLPITRSDAYPLDEMRDFSLIFQRYTPVSEIADEIASLLDDTERIQTMRQHLLDKSQEFSYEHVSKRYTQMYNSLF